MSNWIDTINSELQQFASIDVKGLDAVNFLNRKDEKFMLALPQLPQLLRLIQPHYKVLEINNLRIFHYDSTYYDTPDFLLYRLHHMGKLNRYKIRQRSYTDSSMHFLEVKFKNNKDRTIKSRLKLQQPEDVSTEKSQAFIAENSPHQLINLIATANTAFDRITLVSNDGNDRCTIDLNLNLKANQEQVQLNHIAIVEVKQERFAGRSEMSKALKMMRIREASFSKYCMAVSYCAPDQKNNRFKPIQLLVNRLKSTF